MGLAGTRGGPVLSTRAVLQRCISGLHEDARFRNRILASVLTVALLVGAFASGLEVQVRFGPGTSGDQTALARSDRSVPLAPSGPGTRVAPTPPSTPTRPAGADDLAPLVLDPAPGPPALSPGPAIEPDGPAGPGIGAPEVPAVPDLPGPQPGSGPGFPEGDDQRCLVTDTIILVPIDPEAIPGKACEEATGELDEVRAPDVDVPDPPDAPAGQQATADDPGWIQRALAMVLGVRSA
jgi:hypothetical protein